MRILVVDDETVSRVKLANILASIGETQAASSGKDAIEQYDQSWHEFTPFDLICLDVNMPGVNGIEVLKYIRRKEDEMGVKPWGRVKVFMVTALSDKTTVGRVREVGCDGYIVKPFEPRRVIEKIKSMFDAHFEYSEKKASF